MNETKSMSRREVLKRAALAAGASVAATATARESAPAAGSVGFIFSLNLSTIRGQKLGIVAEIETAAKAGYNAIEPWLDSLHKYAEAGNSLRDLGKRIADLGLVVPSAIGFPQWIVDGDAKRAAGLEQTKRDMDAVAQIGGKRLACPPAGATKEPLIDPRKIAERYRAVLELGDQMGVIPELELWGHSQNIRTLADAAFIAIAAEHPKACILADVFHLYKGGSGFEGLQLMSGVALPTMHMNDYPADPPREKIDDSFRVYPGDGAAPLGKILRTLHDNGARTALSLELFNREYWQQDALTVARTGLEKMKAVVAKALA